jgi:hypothetical protein
MTKELVIVSGKGGTGITSVAAWGSAPRSCSRHMASVWWLGAPAESPEMLAADYLSGMLQVGGNVYDH